MPRPKTVEEHIRNLQDTINFQRSLVAQQKEEIYNLKEELKKLQAVIKNQPIPIQYEQFDPQNYKDLYTIIDREAIAITKDLGREWYWKKLYDKIRLNPKYSATKWNPETVRRRCQLLVKDGMLKRVAPGTYIYICKPTSVI